MSHFVIKLTLGVILIFLGASSYAIEGEVVESPSKATVKCYNDNVEGNFTALAKANRDCFNPNGDLFDELNTGEKWCDKCPKIGATSNSKGEASDQALLTKKALGLVLDYEVSIGMRNLTSEIIKADRVFGSFGLGKEFAKECKISRITDVNSYKKLGCTSTDGLEDKLTHLLNSTMKADKFSNKKTGKSSLPLLSPLNKSLPRHLSAGVNSYNNECFSRGLEDKFTNKIVLNEMSENFKKFKKPYKFEDIKQLLGEFEGFKAMNDQEWKKITKGLEKITNLKEELPRIAARHFDKNCGGSIEKLQKKIAEKLCPSSTTNLDYKKLVDRYPASVKELVVYPQKVNLDKISSRDILQAELFCKIDGERNLRGRKAKKAFKRVKNDIRSEFRDIDGKTSSYVLDQHARVGDTDSSIGLSRSLFSSKNNKTMDEQLAKLPFEKNKFLADDFSSYVCHNDKKSKTKKIKNIKELKDIFSHNCSSVSEGEGRLKEVVSVKSRIKLKEVNGSSQIMVAAELRCRYLAEIINSTEKNNIKSKRARKDWIRDNPGKKAPPVEEFERVLGSSGFIDEVTGSTRKITKETQNSVPIISQTEQNSDSFKEEVRKDRENGGNLEKRIHRETVEEANQSSDEASSISDRSFADNFNSEISRGSVRSPASTSKTSSHVTTGSSYSPDEIFKKKDEALEERVKKLRSQLASFEKEAKTNNYTPSHLKRVRDHYKDQIDKNLFRQSSLREKYPSFKNKYGSSPNYNSSSFAPSHSVGDSKGFEAAAPVSGSLAKGGSIKSAGGASRSAASSGGAGGGSGAPASSGSKGQAIDFGSEEFYAGKVTEQELSPSSLKKIALNTQNGIQVNKGEKFTLILKHETGSFHVEMYPDKNFEEDDYLYIPEIVGEMSEPAFKLFKQTQLYKNNVFDQVQERFEVDNGFRRVDLESAAGLVREFRR